MNERIRFEATIAGVSEFVEATLDSNPIHREHDAARRLLEKLNLSGAEQTYVVVPGMYAFSYVAQKVMPDFKKMTATWHALRCTGQSIDAVVLTNGSVRKTKEGDVSVYLSREQGHYSRALPNKQAALELSVEESQIRRFLRSLQSDGTSYGEQVPNACVASLIPGAILESFSKTLDGDWLYASQSLMIYSPVAVNDKLSIIVGQPQSKLGFYNLVVTVVKNGRYLVAEGHSKVMQIKQK